MFRPWIALLGFFAPSLALAAFADGQGDNLPEKVRPVPPPGISVPDADRAALEQGLTELGHDVEALRGNAKAAPLLPDVRIYENAVRYALHYNEFFAPREIERAKALLAQGRERARLLSMGQSPWVTDPGLSARGYVSAIDGSVQPYGLYVPESFTPNRPHRWRVDTWFHGRGENLSEVNFIDGVQRSGGQFIRPDTFTLQPYGRYCNANKLAGEVDLFEALDAVRRQYRVDENRIIVRGFSMGGAACWQFAAHYASDWCAAAPGAGFSETPEFLRVFQQEKVAPTWWEQQLWQMYDCPVYAANFFNLPTVAYSGELDSQKQAADVMEKALAKEGIQLTHLIGPGTHHAYHAQSIPQINERIDRIAEKGRTVVPRRVRLSTATLKYNRQAWVTVDGLAKHWEPARVDAQIDGPHAVSVATENVTALTLSMPSGTCPLDDTPLPGASPSESPLTVTVDGQRLPAPAVRSDRSWEAHFRRQGDRWLRVEKADDGTLRKLHDLQGPIDDAFTEPFLIVRPTGTPAMPGVSKWIDAEMGRAIREWRRQFRGEPRLKNDADVTDADVANYNLVLWGDPGSNQILGRIADRLPILWTRNAVAVGSQRYPSDTHAPILITPNPLNLRRYVVLNSGFTFREYDYLNNARQVPRLPDWAIVDTTTPPNSRWPGKIANAGFFNERWELSAGEPK